MTLQWRSEPNASRDCMAHSSRHEVHRIEPVSCVGQQSAQAVQKVVNKA